MRRRVWIGEHDIIDEDLRQRISSILVGRLDVIAADARTIFPQSAGAGDGDEPVALAGPLLCRLIAIAVERPIDADDIDIAALRTLAVARGVAIRDLFALAYQLERAALDELALDQEIGVTSERWAAVAQLVRRASFEVLGALTAQSAAGPGAESILDRATTLHTRALFDTVLAKEADRAGRFGYAIALVIFDVDRLGDLNERHGRVVGNRILEHLGVLIRQYFRQHDWVARDADDAVAVLLTRTDADHADELADKVRTTVEDRLAFTDGRTGAKVAVTVSAGVVFIAGEAGTLIEPERMRLDAAAALDRAKQAGRNRVVRVEASASASRTPPHSSPSV